MILTASGRDARTLRWDEAAPLGLQEQPASPVPGGRLWIGHSGKHNRISIIASVDGGALHVSIAHSNRYPTWDEILSVRAWGFPEEMEVVMVLARKSEYVNVHNNCFHLWESACGRAWAWSKGETKRRMRRRSGVSWLNGRVIPALQWLERWGVLSLCGLAVLAASVLYASLPEPGLVGLAALLLLAVVALATLALVLFLERR